MSTDDVAPHGDGDGLPDELDVSSYVGRYTFPDIRRRRRPGVLYLVVAGVCLVLWLARGGATPLVNSGILAAAVVLAVVGAYHLATAWPLAVRETDALISAARHVGFPVGHASGQLGWRGLRSRPVWRILLYSSENPPERRGFVLVDAVDGAVVEHLVEDNPEEWAE